MVPDVRLVFTMKGAWLSGTARNIVSVCIVVVVKTLPALSLRPDSHFDVAILSVTRNNTIYTKLLATAIIKLSYHT